MKHTVLITGAAGYVGAMLVEKFAAREDVHTIIGIDKEPKPEAFNEIEKLTYFEINTADEWEDLIEGIEPDIVIHTAWQIREIYGNHALTWRWNIDGSDKVFDYVFSHPNVKRLVHFSTVASYGAYPENTIEQRFTEKDPFRLMDYLYAEEKRITESHLEEKYEGRLNKDISVAIVRPAAITGPRGRYMRIRFGLQATLSGQMKDSFAYRVVSAMVSVVPITPKWVRQFIHEDDVAGIVSRLAFGEPVQGYEVFNICPPGKVVRGNDMAMAVGKRALPVSPWMVRLPFFVFWHLTRGKIPTGRGAWKSYSYPIAVDGSKVSRELGYVYKHEGFDAFYYTDGEYEYAVPPLQRRNKEK
ncbi:MAG: UDP-glucose 4-epimerase [Parcubacteria bacterium C7867-008]|nr:MAG: UDP-glucose 4-epimerase [Parcubacteria bacterium C7867-008]